MDFPYQTFLKNISSLALDFFIRLLLAKLRLIVGELHPVQARVHAFRLEQSLVRTRFYDSPFVQHDYLVGLFHRRKSVRDDERRSVFHQYVQRVLDTAFRLCIERRRCFIENQDRRVF